MSVLLVGCIGVLVLVGVCVGFYMGRQQSPVVAPTEQRQPRKFRLTTSEQRKVDDEVVVKPRPPINPRVMSDEELYYAEFEKPGGPVDPW